MKVLVAGAGGFLGRAIVAELLAEKHEVFCLVSLKSKDFGDLPNIFRGDIADLESLDALGEIKNVETIIHAAGLAHQFGKTSDKEFWKVNVGGTENIARLAVNLKAKHFVLISSVAVYGETDEKGKAVDEKTVCNPQSIYARSKFESENVAREVCEKNGMALTILRPVTIIGEDDRGNTARLIEAIAKRKFLWIGTGENHKSLIYKADVAKACRAVLAKKTSETEVFNVAGEACTMNFIVSEIAKHLNRKIPKLKISVPFLQKVFRANEKIFRTGKISTLAETVEKWISEDVFSGEKIAEIYGFRAETLISEGLRRQVLAYRKTKNCNATVIS